MYNVVVPTYLKTKQHEYMIWVVSFWNGCFKVDKKKLLQKLLHTKCLPPLNEKKKRKHNDFTPNGGEIEVGFATTMAKDPIKMAMC